MVKLIESAIDQPPLRDEVPQVIVPVIVPSPLHTIVSLAPLILSWSAVILAVFQYVWDALDESDPPIELKYEYGDSPGSTASNWYLDTSGYFGYDLMVGLNGA